MDAAISVNIPYLNGFDNLHTIEDIAEVLDAHERRPIAHAPWSAGAKQPEVSFALAYGKDDIYLKYYVKEHT
jgi:hypothetical protein